MKGIGSLAAVDAVPLDQTTARASRFDGLGKVSKRSATDQVQGHPWARRRNHGLGLAWIAARPTMQGAAPVRAHLSPSRASAEVQR
jgi:hypothetical protein